jgi:PGF-pre-PGF domain-containing protein
VKKRTLALFASLLLIISSASALNAQIDQSPPEDIVLDSGNSYKLTENYSSSSSTGDIKSREWNMLDTSQTDSDVQAEFTFSRTNGVSFSNTIRLTVSNGSSTSVDEVTQNVHDVPNASVNPETTDVKKGETVEFSSTVTNTFDSPVSYSWKWNGSGSVTGSNETLEKTFDTTGTYSVWLEVTDDAGYSSQTDKATVTVTSSGNNNNNGGNGGSDSGGGGGGLGGLPSQNESSDEDSGNASDERPGTPETKRVTAESRNGVAQVTVQKGEGVRNISVNVDPVSDRTPVKRIRISSGASGEVSVSVRDAGREKPDQVPEPASDDEENVYGYQEINTSINDSEVEAAEIDFSVNRSWLNDRNRTKDEVRMKRYNGTDWESLPTRHINSTESAHNFEASSTGFSYYAIALEEQAETPGNQTADQMQEERDIPFLPIVLILTLVMLVAVAYVKREEFLGMMGSGKLKRKKLERKMDSIRESLENGGLDKEEREDVLESVERADNLIQQNELDEAEKIINRIQRKVEE